MMCAEYVKELARITGCKDDATFYEICEKVETVFEGLLGVKSVSGMTKYNFTVVPFPGMNREDSVYLHDLYNQSAEDTELRELIKKIVIAAVTPRIIGCVSEMARTDTWDIFKNDVNDTKYTLIADCVMSISSNIEKFDPGFGASYVSWLYANIPLWLEDAEWKRYQFLHGIKANKKEWLRVYNGVKACSQAHVEVNVENVRAAIIKAERSTNPDHSKIKYSTVRDILPEVTSVTVYYGANCPADDNDGTGSLLECLDSRGQVFKAGGSLEYYSVVEESVLGSEDDSETDDIENIYEILLQRASCSPVLIWFVDYIKYYMDHGGMLSSVEKLIKQASKQYCKEHACGKTKRTRVEEQFRRFFSPINNETENIVAEDTADNGKTLDDIWAEVLADAMI